MAQQSRKPIVRADVQVIDELTPAEARSGVRVRAKTAKGHEDDARPIGGFYIKRRYAGDEFIITKPEQFSQVWMEFVDEPPAEWVTAMKLNDDRKAELMVKQQEPTPAPSMDALVFAMSQAISRSVGRPPTDFDHSSGRFKEPPAGNQKASGEAI
jgi:hypothetical protein